MQARGLVNGLESSKHAGKAQKAEESCTPIASVAGCSRSTSGSTPDWSGMGSFRWGVRVAAAKCVLGGENVHTEASQEQADHKRWQGNERCGNTSHGVTEAAADE
jgi:hypothetical protein